MDVEVREDEEQDGDQEGVHAAESEARGSIAERGETGAVGVEEGVLPAV